VHLDVVHLGRGERGTGRARAGIARTGLRGRDMLGACLPSSYHRHLTSSMPPGSPSKKTAGGTYTRTRGASTATNLTACLGDELDRVLAEVSSGRMTLEDLAAYVRPTGLPN